MEVRDFGFDLPNHALGGASVAFVLKQGDNHFQVVYDSKLLHFGSNFYWTHVAFHEACHAGLGLWPSVGAKKVEVQKAENEADACADKWMHYLGKKRK